MAWATAVALLAELSAGSTAHAAHGDAYAAALSACEEALEWPQAPPQQLVGEGISWASLDGCCLY